jgi:hypothetical protein
MGRPIDIVIEGGGRFIPIEAKIYAIDQNGQCYDYCAYARTKDKAAKIVYLTLFGDAPSKDSRGELGDDDIILLSFSTTAQDSAMLPHPQAASFGEICRQRSFA